MARKTKLKPSPMFDSNIIFAVEKANDTWHSMIATMDGMHCTESGHCEMSDAYAWVVRMYRKTLE